MSGKQAVAEAEVLETLQNTDDEQEEQVTDNGDEGDEGDNQIEARTAYDADTDANEGDDPERASHDENVNDPYPGNLNAEQALGEGDEGDERDEGDKPEKPGAVGNEETEIPSPAEVEAWLKEQKQIAEEEWEEMIRSQATENAKLEREALNGWNAPANANNLAHEEDEGDSGNERDEGEGTETEQVLAQREGDGQEAAQENIASEDQREEDEGDERGRGDEAHEPESNLPIGFKGLIEFGQVLSRIGIPSKVVGGEIPHVSPSENYESEESEEDNYEDLRNPDGTFRRGWEHPETTMSDSRAKEIFEILNGRQKASETYATINPENVQANVSIPPAPHIAPPVVRPAKAREVGGKEYDPEFIKLEDARRKGEVLYESQNNQPESKTPQQDKNPLPATWSKHKLHKRKEKFKSGLISAARDRKAQSRQVEEGFYEDDAPETIRNNGVSINQTTITRSPSAEATQASAEKVTRAARNRKARSRQVEEGFYENDIPETILDNGIPINQNTTTQSPLAEATQASTEEVTPTLTLIGSKHGSISLLKDISPEPSELEELGSDEGDEGEESEKGFTPDEGDEGDENELEGNEGEELEEELTATEIGKGEELEEGPALSDIDEGEEPEKEQDSGESFNRTEPLPILNGSASSAHEPMMLDDVPANVESSSLPISPLSREFPNSRPNDLKLSSELPVSQPATPPPPLSTTTSSSISTAGLSSSAQLTTPQRGANGLEISFDDLQNPDKFKDMARNIKISEGGQCKQS